LSPCGERGTGFSSPLSSRLPSPLPLRGEGNRLQLAAFFTSPWPSPLAGRGEPASARRFLHVSLALSLCGERGTGVSSRLSSPARRSLPPLRLSTSSERKRSATWRRHPGSP